MIDDDDDDDDAHWLDLFPVRQLHVIPTTLKSENMRNHQRRAEMPPNQCEIWWSERCICGDFLSLPYRSIKVWIVVPPRDL